MKKIKVFAYKADYNTPVLKTVLAEQLDDTIIFCETLKDGWGENEYSYYFDLGNDLFYPIAKHTRTSSQNMINWYNDNKKLCTIESIFNTLKQKVQNKQWTSNLDTFFCETLGNFELAEKCRQNRLEYLEAQEKEREQERIQREEKEKERALKEQQQAEEELKQGENKLKNGEFITPKQFEMLAAKYKISLSPKFLGWLREYCGDIRIKARTQQEIESLPAGVGFLNTYNIVYYYEKGHKSTSMNKFADLLASAMNI